MNNFIYSKMFFILKIKYKEEYEKTKGRALATKDSRLLHSLQVAKMSSEVNNLFSLFNIFFSIVKKDFISSAS